MHHNLGEQRLTEVSSCVFVEYCEEDMEILAGVSDISSLVHSYSFLFSNAVLRCYPVSE